MFRIVPVAEGIVSTCGLVAQPCIINTVVQRYRTRWRMSRRRCRTNACAVLLCFKLALCKAAVKECDNSVYLMFSALEFCRAADRIHMSWQLTRHGNGYATNGTPMKTRFLQASKAARVAIRLTGVSDLIRCQQVTAGNRVGDTLNSEPYLTTAIFSFNPFIPA